MIVVNMINVYQDVDFLPGVFVTFSATAFGLSRGKRSFVVFFFGASLFDFLLFDETAAE